MILLASYQQLVMLLKNEIQSARIRAALSNNSQMIALYWKIGKAILLNQEAEGWGAKIIDNLSKDLRYAFPDMQGISPRNLKYMRAFANAYPQFVQPPAAQTTDIVQTPLIQLNETEFVQQPAAQLPWFHICTLLDKIKDPDERLYYMQQTVVCGWSRNVLVHQIESNLYQRKGKAITNFEATLPKPQSDLAQEMLKDPYKFDFLSLSEEYKEKDLEDALVKHITKFLLELGAGFSYVGRQYPLMVDGKERNVDLLFYHLKLRCFVIVDLKTGEFMPEYAGKMNFYLNVADDQLRHESDGRSIGMIICKDRNKVVAEYALRGIDKPIGVTEYSLSQSIPENLKGSLPTIEEIEAELNEGNEAE